MFFLPKTNQQWPKIETDFRLDCIRSTSLTDENPSSFPPIVSDLFQNKQLKNLKSVSVCSYYCLFFGLKTYRIYHVLTQPERELLSSRYGTRNTQHMHDQTMSVQSSHWVYMLCYYSLSKHERSYKPGIVTFSRRHRLFVRRRTSRKQLGKTVEVLVS